MKARIFKNSAKEFQKWLKEYLSYLPEPEKITNLTPAAQQKLMRKAHPEILNQLTQKKMPPDMREYLDTYLQILIKNCI